MRCAIFLGSIRQVEKIKKSAKMGETVFYIDFPNDELFEAKIFWAELMPFFGRRLKSHVLMQFSKVNFNELRFIRPCTHYSALRFDSIHVNPEEWLGVFCGGAIT